MISEEEKQKNLAYVMEKHFGAETWNHISESINQ